MTKMSVKAKKYLFHKQPKAKTDCCPKCRLHFRSKKIILLWKDVVECHWCGLVWVLLDLEEFRKWK